ncbi:hypothetical protein HDV64DRAFT_18601 [Trichoderma sp. TUCIM 5745]
MAPDRHSLTRISATAQRLQRVLFKVVQASQRCGTGVAPLLSFLFFFSPRWTQPSEVIGNRLSSQLHPVFFVSSFCSSETLNRTQFLQLSPKRTQPPKVTATLDLHRRELPSQAFKQASRQVRLKRAKKANVFLPKDPACGALPATAKARTRQDGWPA